MEEGVEAWGCDMPKVTQLVSSKAKTEPGMRDVKTSACSSLSQLPGTALARPIFLLPTPAKTPHVCPGQYIFLHTTFPLCTTSQIWSDFNLTLEINLKNQFMSNG